MPEHDETVSLDTFRVIGVTCPKCGHKLQIPERFYVDGTVCPKCSAHIQTSENTIEALESDQVKEVLSTVFEPSDPGLTVSAFLNNDRLEKAGPKMTQADILEESGENVPRQGQENHYKMMGVIGTGGMGTVLAAKDMSVRRTVAMKVLNDKGKVYQDDLLRFIGEAQVTGQLEHPGILPVYELGVDEDNNVYYTMKYARGMTLKEVLDEIRDGDEDTIRKYPLSRLVNIFIRICDGMAYAHSRGVIHRDLKPANIMIGDYGEVLVLDWGLARIMFKSDSAKRRFGGVEEIQSIRSDDGDVHTMTGTVLGTPAFMSPEQARGDVNQLDERSDIYSLGAILYNILSLHHPIEANSVNVLFTMLINGVVTPIESWNPGTSRSETVLPHCPGHRIPDSLGAVAMKAMALRAGNRYQTVKDVQNEVASWQGGHATIAEEASILREFKLLAKRHAGILVSILVTALLLIAIAGGATMKTSRALETHKRRARVTGKELTTMKKTLDAVTMKESALLAKNDENEKRISGMISIERHQAQRLYLERIRLATEYVLNTPKRPIRGIETLKRCDTELRHMEWYYVKNSLPSAERLKAMSRSIYGKTLRGNLMIPSGRIVWPRSPMRTKQGMNLIGGSVYQLVPNGVRTNWDGTYMAMPGSGSIVIINETGSVEDTLPLPKSATMGGTMRVSRTGKLVLINLLVSGTRRLGTYDRVTREWHYLEGWLDMAYAGSPWHTRDDKVWMDGALVPLARCVTFKTERQQFFMRQYVVLFKPGTGFSVYLRSALKTSLIEVPDTQNSDPIWHRYAHDRSESVGLFHVGSSEIRIYQFSDGKLRHRFVIDQNVLGVGMSEDGKRIMTMNADGRFHLYTQDGGEILSIKIKGALTTWRYAIRPTQNGRSVLITSETGRQFAVIIK